MEDQGESRYFFDPQALGTRHNMRVIALDLRMSQAMIYIIGKKIASWITSSWAE